MVGDWGYDDDHTAQSGVTSGMLLYAKQHGLKPQALLMLGENWYRELADGAHSSRWQTQFEEMYRADVFACPAYAIAGNHDYQRWPESKVAAELEYARIGKRSEDPPDGECLHSGIGLSFPRRSR
jgi:tartrate-resistant acid phosphatase type 5